ncbi:MAG TPA: hypothetical protein VF507_05505 [Pyrinomonadaceae bacterium]
MNSSATGRGAAGVSQGAEPATGCIIIITSGGLVEHAWPCASVEDGEKLLRRWYAIRRAVFEFSSGLPSTTPDAVQTAEAGATPVTATVEEISDWFRNASFDLTIQILPASQDPLERELESADYLTEPKRSLLREAILAASTIFD